MAGCAKCGPVCNCHLQAGTNVTVTGTGTRRDPWVVSAGGGGGAFICADLETCSIHSLGDVSDTPPNSGDVLVWNGTTYVPTPGGGSGGFTCSLLAACALGDLGNVDESAAIAGFFLGFNGTGWVAVPPPGGSGFVCSDLNLCPVSALSDVDTTGAVAGDVFELVGGQWVPRPLISADAGNTAVVGTDAGVFVPVSGGGTCPDDTEFLDVISLCAPGGDPIGVVVERSCGTGEYDEIGWLDLGTGVFTPGAPPTGSGPCGTLTAGMTASVERMAPMSVTGVGADIAVAWDTENYDTGPMPPGLWDPAFPTRLNAQSRGWWHFSVGLEISAQVVASTITSEEVYLRRGGDANDVWYPQANTSQSDAAGLLSMSITTGGLIFLEEGDYIEVLIHPLVALFATTTDTRRSCRAVWRFLGT